MPLVKVRIWDTRGPAARLLSATAVLGAGQDGQGLLLVVVYLCRTLHGSCPAKLAGQARVPELRDSFSFKLAFII